MSTTQIRLTNGTETFLLTPRNEDSKGSLYQPCEAGCCDHNEAPAGAKVWHDDAYTETLWEA
jgi:hypothetical protein